MQVLRTFLEEGSAFHFNLFSYARCKVNSIVLKDLKSWSWILIKKKTLQHLCLSLQDFQKYLKKKKKHRNKLSNKGRSRVPPFFCDSFLGGRKKHKGGRWQNRYSLGESRREKGKLQSRNQGRGGEEERSPIWRKIRFSLIWSLNPSLLVPAP